MVVLKFWLSLGLFALVLIFMFVAFLLKKRDKKKLVNCTSKTSGEVYGYEARGNGLFYPLVEFEVDGTSYKGKLVYRGIIVKAATFYGEAEVIGDKFAPTLRVKRNPRLSFNPLEKEIPRGSVLDVYYNPENPEENYVQRYVKSIVSQIFFYGAVYFIIMGIFLYLVL